MPSKPPLLKGKVPYCACGHPKAWHDPECSHGCGCTHYHARPRRSVTSRTSATARGDVAPRGHATRDAPAAGDGLNGNTGDAIAEKLSERAFSHPPSKAERRVLRELAAHAALSRTQLAILCHYSQRTKNFLNAIGSLRSAGLLEGSADRLRITPAGRAVAGDVEALPPAGPPLQAYWRSRLNRAERIVFEALLDRSWANKDELAARCGYSPRTKNFLNAIGRLRTLGLCEPFALRASGTLFQ